jgi:hypothetical protein
MAAVDGADFEAGPVLDDGETVGGSFLGGGVVDAGHCVLLCRVAANNFACNIYTTKEKRRQVISGSICDAITLS